MDRYHKTRQVTPDVLANWPVSINSLKMVY